MTRFERGTYQGRGKRNEDDSRKQQEVQEEQPAVNRAELVEDRMVVDPDDSDRREAD
jgi:hypothetical protein